MEESWPFFLGFLLGAVLTALAILRKETDGPCAHEWNCDLAELKGDVIVWCGHCRKCGAVHAHKKAIG